MNNDTLLLIDLNKNFNLNEKNKQYIYLNNGKINLRNCKQIKLKNFSYLKKDFQKKMINEFKKIIYRDPKNKFFLSEMEFFNKFCLFLLFHQSSILILFKLSNFLKRLLGDVCKIPDLINFFI